MMNLPSKELLSEVLSQDFSTRHTSTIQVMGNTVRYSGICNSLPFNNKINIYELAHKCKEWALKKGFYLVSWVENNLSWCEVSDVGLNNNETKEHIEAYTEYESVFKACQWILDNKAKA